MTDRPVSLGEVMAQQLGEIKSVEPKQESKILKVAPVGYCADAGGMKNRRSERTEAQMKYPREASKAIKHLKREASPRLRLVSPYARIRQP